MANELSADDLLEFLGHVSERGLMPATTAQALAVASRNVLGILSEAERSDLAKLDLDAVIKRFTNKRAKDFNPSSLKEYGRRLRRAVDLFTSWRNDPANFSVKTRATANSSRRDRNARTETSRAEMEAEPTEGVALQTDRAYQSAFLIRPGIVVTISNIPNDLTAAEAERLAQFVKMLGVG